jgi:hypothetical protein
MMTFKGLSCRAPYCMESAPEARVQEEEERGEERRGVLGRRKAVVVYVWGGGKKGKGVSGGLREAL